MYQSCPWEHPNGLPPSHHPICQDKKGMGEVIRIAITHLQKEIIPAAQDKQVGRPPPLLSRVFEVDTDPVLHIFHLLVLPPIGFEVLLTVVVVVIIVVPFPSL